MKLTISQLRALISEEVSRAKKRKIKLGDVFTNPKGDQISVEFLEDGFAGWELITRGKAHSRDGEVSSLEKAIADGNFTHSRTENVF